MAQYYGEEERSQVGEQGQENPSFERDNESRSDDCKKDLQAEKEPQSMTYKEEEAPGEGVIGDERDYNEDRSDGFKKDLQAEREPENMKYNEEKVPVDEGIGEDARGPDRAEGKSDYSDLKGAGKEDAGYENTTEMPAEVQNAPTQDGSTGERGLSDVTEQSPYTQYESKEDYNKQAYGGEGYQQPKPDEETEDVARGGEECETNPEKQTECAERGFSSPTEAEKYDESQQHEPGLKDKMLHNLVPCHKTDTVEDEQPHGNGVPKSPGFMEKMKQKLTGKSPELAPGYGTTDTPPKKNMFEKVKEKLSPST